MNDARNAVMEALMRLINQKRMPPAQPQFRMGVNGSPVTNDQPPTPAPSVGIRG